MSGRWWRAYSRARHDPKLLKLRDKYFRWWFDLVCVASERGGYLPHEEDLAAEFRVKDGVIEDVLFVMGANGLFEKTEDGWRPRKWDELQYQSDVSTSRVKRFRERQGNGERNVSVTPSESESESDTEADTDTDTEKKESERATRSGSRLPEDWQPSADDRAFAEPLGIDVDATASVFRDYWHGIAGARGRKADWAGTWRNWVRRETSARKPPPRMLPNGSSGETVIDGAGQWTARLRGWAQSKFWKPYDWGPEPGHPRCLVPPHLLPREAA